jgi:hypothetical protein
MIISCFVQTIKFLTFTLIENSTIFFTSEICCGNQGIELIYKKNIKHNKIQQNIILIKPLMLELHKTIYLA